MSLIIATLHTRPKVLALVIASSLLSLTLVGCGSDSGGNNSGNDSSNNGGTNNGGGGSNGSGDKPPVVSSGFSKTATWTVTDFSPESTSCYDFDTQAASDCSNNEWDIKFDNQARSVKLWSNSGDSGTGKGGVFGLMDWADLGRYKNATQDPETSRDITSHYNADRSGGIFDAQPWFEYNLNGSHQLYPNNRVYLLTSDSSAAATESSVQQPVYAMQITNYYSDTGLSGHPTIRWIDTALPNKVRTQTIDASDSDNWVYFDLTTGKTTNDKNARWQVGFKRNSVILNGGDSGNGKVGGYLAATPAGYYDNTTGELIASKFMTDGSTATLANLTNSADYAKPTSARSWVLDRKGSDLNPEPKGGYPNIDYGWFTYRGAANNHQLEAKPIASSQGALIRSAAGNSYARIRLDKINYPNPTAGVATSWEFKLDIQPAVTR